MPIFALKNNGRVPFIGIGVSPIGRVVRFVATLFLCLMGWINFETHKLAVLHKYIGSQYIKGQINSLWIQNMASYRVYSLHSYQMQGYEIVWKDSTNLCPFGGKSTNKRAKCKRKVRFSFHFRAKVLSTGRTFNCQSFMIHYSMALSSFDHGQNTNTPRCNHHYTLM